jgi:hypothetical protein
MHIDVENFTPYSSKYFERCGSATENAFRLSRSRAKLDPHLAHPQGKFLLRYNDASSGTGEW